MLTNSIESKYDNLSNCSSFIPANQKNNLQNLISLPKFRIETLCVAYMKNKIESFQNNAKLHYGSLCHVIVASLETNRTNGTRHCTRTIGICSAWNYVSKLNEWWWLRRCDWQFGNKNIS